MLILGFAYRRGQSGAHTLAPRVGYLPTPGHSFTNPTPPNGGFRHELALPAAHKLPGFNILALRTRVFHFVKATERVCSTLGMLDFHALSQG